MKTKNLMTVATIALGTATLTVLTFWSGPLEAGNEAGALAAKIPTPKLVAHGVELTLVAAGGQTYKAGDEPAFELSAVNPTSEPATVEVRVAMTSSSPASAMSRVLVLPTALWQHNQSVVLEPHETKVIPLATRTKLPPNTMIAVTIQEAAALEPATVNRSQVALGPQFAPVRTGGIVALNFSTVSPAAGVASVE